MQSLKTADGGTQPPACKAGTSRCKGSCLSMTTTSNIGECGKKCGSNSACVSGKCTCKTGYMQDPLSANCVKPCGEQPCHAPYKCVNNVCTAEGYGVFNPYSSPKCSLDPLPSSRAQCMKMAPKQSKICSGLPPQETCRPFVGEGTTAVVLTGSACDSIVGFTSTITGKLLITAPVGNRIHNITFYNTTADFHPPIDGAMLMYNENESVLTKSGTGFLHEHAIDFTIPFSDTLYAKVTFSDQFKDPFRDLYEVQSNVLYANPKCDISSSE